MLWNDVIELIPTIKQKNSMGDTFETDGEPIQVFANKKSIRQSEFYQAMSTDLKPELMFEIREEDYIHVTKVKYNNNPYRVIRTYSKNGEIMELVLEGLTPNG